MTAERFAEIQKSFDAAKASADKAEGAKDQLLEALKKDYFLDTIEDAEEELETLARDLTKVDQEIDSYSNELEAIADWDAL